MKPALYHYWFRASLPMCRRPKCLGHGTVPFYPNVIFIEIVKEREYPFYGWYGGRPRRDGPMRSPKFGIPAYHRQEKFPHISPKSGSRF